MLAIRILFAAGRAGYELVSSSQMPLPSIRTLNKRLQIIKFLPGILFEIMNILPLKKEQIDEEDLDCVLGLDEMAIQGQKDLDRNTMTLLGLCTLPIAPPKYNKQEKASLGNDSVRIENAQKEAQMKSLHSVAEKVLVFVLGGIRKRWKQTVGYHFTSKSFDGHLAKDNIISILKQIHSIGLFCRVIISDMGARQIWNAFGLTVGRDSNTNWIPHPCDPNEKLWIILDTVHVFKAILEMLRSNGTLLLDAATVAQHNLPTNTVKLKDLLDLCVFQEKMRWKLAPKLKELYLKQNHFNKMSVRVTTSVFNLQTAAALTILSKLPEGNPGMITTAWFITLVANWFKIMTARSLKLAMSLHNMSAYNKSIECLKLTMQVFQNMQAGKEWKPCQTGVKSCTQCILELAEYYLLKRKFKFFLSGRFTTDFVENIFSLFQYRCPKPSPVAFKSRLKEISVSQFLQEVPKSSYELDDRRELISFLDYINPSDSVTDSDKPATDYEEYENFAQSFFTYSSQNQQFDKLMHTESYAFYRVSGYIAYKVMEEKPAIAECEVCFAFCKHQGDQKHEFADLTRLTNFKEDALWEVSDAVFKLLVQCKERLLTFENLLPFMHTDNHQYALHKIEDIVGSAEFPPCHDLAGVLVRRFLHMRLKQGSWAQKAPSTADSRSVFSSRSMGSRHLADNFVVSAKGERKRNLHRIAM